MEQQLQQSYKIDKYDEMIEYLNNNNEYWLKNDKWDMWQIYNYDLKSISGKRYLRFSNITSNNIKLEFKYMIVYCLENKYFKVRDFMNSAQVSLNRFYE